MKKMRMMRIMMKCTTCPRTSMMTAEMILSSDPRGRNSGEQIGKVTHK